MTYPDFISQKDIDRWDQQIEKELDSIVGILPLVKDTCRAGLWLSEQLKEQKCPEDFIVHILYHGGKLSFGRDPWEVHQLLLQQYNNNELILEDNSSPDIFKN